MNWFKLLIHKIGEIIVGLLEFFNVISWEMVVIWLIKLAKRFLVRQLRDADMSYKAKLFVQWIQIGNATLGAKFASETSTPIDDSLIDEIDGLATRLAELHKFSLHKPGSVHPNLDSWRS